MGESTRDKWHQAKPNDRGESMDLPRPEWLLSFDVEAHTYETYEVLAQEIKKGGYQLPTS